MSGWFATCTLICNTESSSHLSHSILSTWYCWFIFWFLPKSCRPKPTFALEKLQNFHQFRGHSCAQKIIFKYEILFWNTFLNCYFLCLLNFFCCCLYSNKILCCPERCTAQLFSSSKCTVLMYFKNIFLKSSMLFVLF